MADIKLQKAVDRIAVKTKQLNTNRKNEHTQTTAEIASVKTDLDNIRTTTEMLADKSKTKQFAKGQDWNTFEELFALISLYDDVNIVVTTKIYLTGVVSSKTGTVTSFKVKGYYAKDTAEDYLGEFEVTKHTGAIAVNITPVGTVKHIQEKIASVPTRKDITSTFKTRVWTNDDIGKKVIIWMDQNWGYTGHITKNSQASQNNIMIDFGFDMFETNHYIHLVYATNISRDQLGAIEVYGNMGEGTGDDVNLIKIKKAFHTGIQKFEIWE